MCPAFAKFPESNASLDAQMIASGSFFFRFSMEKLIGVGSCCLRLQDEGGGG